MASESHFPFVHTATFGLAQETVVPPLEMGDLPDGYRGYVYEVNANNTSDAGQTVTGQEAAPSPTNQVWSTYCCC